MSAATSTLDPSLDRDVFFNRGVGIGETQATLGFIREHIEAIAAGRTSPHTHEQVLGWCDEVERRLDDTSVWNAQHGLLANDKAVDELYGR